MNFKKILIGSAAVLSLAACSKSNDNKSAGNAVSNAPALTDNGVNADNYVAGTPNYTFDVASKAIAVDGVTIGAVDENTFAGYPMLASQINDLSTTDRVIQTKENSVELYSGGSLLLAFDLRSGSPTLMHSRSGSFQIQNAIWTMAAGDQGQGQGLSIADLTINMQECMAEQGQDQGKAPIDQGQDQGKAPIDQGQDQGKVAPIDQGQDQGKKLMTGTGEQGQEQGAPEEKPAQQCKVASITLHLTEIAQPKQEQGQDQGKVAPIDQGKDQGQDQGKAPAPAPIDQGKDQGQDQGKAPAPAPIDQGKDQGQDQGQGK